MTASLVRIKKSVMYTEIRYACVLTDTELPD